MIYVANKLMESMGAFSHRFRLIAELVVGGPQWLRFAMFSHTDTYMVGSEAELLALMQEGLHASSQMLLTELNLLTDPFKLWSLPEEDLALLGTARREHSVLDILAKYNLFDFNSLRVGEVFLESLGILDKAVFQVMNLSDRLALMDLALTAGNQDADKIDIQAKEEASQFALQHSQNAREFVAGFRLYFAVLEKFPARTRKTRLKRVQIVWEDYNELCDSLVETFTLGKGYDSKDLSMEIKNALAGLRQIGFSNKSDALRNLMQNTLLKCQDQPLARKIVSDYMTATVNLISTGKVESREVLQDGVTRLSFASALAAPGGMALVDIDRQGLVTLALAIVENIL
ncbi:MAG: hypothetical protein JEZ02_14735 [Desulfatibacillum sp.]|nr:hypothetical protein [Desulfatibacillum sp.]